MADKLVGVNIYEKALQPIVDLDSDVIVYVPGYAYMGPSEPTLVTASNFTSIFGDSPYKFTEAQTATISQNNVYSGSPEKSWLYAKGLVDAGLTVLYHRCNPSNVGYASSGTDSALLKVGTAASGASLSDPDSVIISGVQNTNNAPKIFAKAKDFGSYYAGMEVAFTPSTTGLTKVTVKKGSETLEEQNISFNPADTLYVGNVSFTYIELFLQTTGDSAVPVSFNTAELQSWYSANQGSALYADTATLTLSLTTTGTDEFSVNDFITLLGGTSSPINQLKDTDLYESVTYITTGGYYQDSNIPKVMTDVAMDIKSMALIDYYGKVSTNDELTALRNALVSLGLASNALKGTTFAGADTFIVDGYRVVLPDSFGYLQKLGTNIAKSIPPWIPVANNPQGVVSAVASTRPVTYATKSSMITNEGISINPIVYKQNTGYTIMGNRTLVATAGVAGPDSFLNCQLVVNTVARAARRAANKLLIVSTNAQTAFSNWKSAVSKTCDKMLVNGDGLASYNILKLKKTKPATIDVKIQLVVQEGIEQFNIYLEYSLNMEQ